MENNNKKKVMSDEQIETLRMQMSSYNNIYDTLADLHNCRLTLQPPCHLTLQPPLPDPCRLTLQPPLPDLPLPGFFLIPDTLADLHNCRLTLQPPLPDPCHLTLHPPLPDLPLPEVKVENTQQKEPLALNGGQRKRWTPTREQIGILESLFKEGEGYQPNMEKIKEITAVLSQHGQVSSVNVYNWFQNRRSRLKKKMCDHKNQMMMKKTY